MEIGDADGGPKRLEADRQGVSSRCAQLVQGAMRKREEANNCQMSTGVEDEIVPQICRLGCWKRIEARGGGWLERGKKIQAGSTSNVTGLGGLGMLIYWAAGCGNDKR